MDFVLDFCFFAFFPFIFIRMLSGFGHVQLLVTPWTVAHLVPLSMGFSRQEYWSGLLCPPPGDLLEPGMEPAPLALADGFFTTSATWKALKFSVRYGI